MTEQRNALAALFAACWKDEALKARFMSDPKAVLAEYDMPVPDGMDVKVVENADNCVHISMPAAPDGHHELSDEELSEAAGGSACPQMGMSCGLQQLFHKIFTTPSSIPPSGPASHS
jgi:hypothetical protein